MTTPTPRGVPAHRIVVIPDGAGGLWLNCFATDPLPDAGHMICPVLPGDTWGDLCRYVAEHDCRKEAR